MGRERTFVVTAEVTVSVSCTVRARGKKEARELAMEREFARFCHQCANGGDGGVDGDEWINPYELDGEPRIVDVEEVGDAE